MEKEERDNKVEDPGERTDAHSAQGEWNEGEEGRTNRPAAPPCLARSSVSASAAGEEGGGGGER